MLFYFVAFKAYLSTCFVTQRLLKEVRKWTKLSVRISRTVITCFEVSYSLFLQMVCQSHFHGHLSLFARLQESTYIDTYHLHTRRTREIHENTEWISISYEKRIQFEGWVDRKASASRISLCSVEKVFVGKNQCGWSVFIQESKSGILFVMLP